MKKLSLVLSLIIAFSVSSFALPALTKAGALDGSNTSVAVGNVSNTGINYHKLAWIMNGTSSACTIKVQGNNDNSTTWTDIISATCTSSGVSAYTGGQYRFIRIFLSSFTDSAGNSNVVFTWAGYFDISTASGGSFLAPNGNCTTPGYAFINATNTGFAWNIGGNAQVTTCIAGSAIFAIDTQSIRMLSTAELQWSGGDPTAASGDVKLARDAAATLGLRNSTTGQRFNIYNTYTDAANNEHLSLAWSTNILFLSTRALGSGTTRALDIGTEGAANLLFRTNATDRWTLAAGSTTLNSAMTEPTYIAEQRTTGVTTSAVSILAANGFGGNANIRGDDGAGKQFIDIVTYGGTTVTVASSNTVAGAPAARTYSVVANQLKVLVASGTYTISASHRAN